MRLWHDIHSARNRDRRWRSREKMERGEMAVLGDQLGQAVTVDFAERCKILSPAQELDAGLLSAQGDLVETKAGVDGGRDGVGRDASAQG